MQKTTAGLALILVLLARADAHDPPDFHAMAPTLAIAAVLGDEINRFEPPLPVPGAGFDEVAENAMHDQIAKDLRDAKIVSIDMPRDAMHDALYPRTGWGDAGMKALREALEPWAAAHPVDYIVIFRKTVGIPGDHAWGHPTFFGIGLFGGMPVAFLNITVLDGKTLDVVTEISLRDVDWGSKSYLYDKSKPTDVPALVEDINGMLVAAVPAMVHGVGL